MNQIICTTKTNFKEQRDYIPSKKIFLLKMLFYILTVFSIFLALYYIAFRYDLYKSEKLSQKLIDNFNITALYPKSPDYTTNLLSQKILPNDSTTSSASVIGLIQINKLNITYPILSDLNNELLKISPCKFYGPNPNEIGNLCIAAHNYKNGTFFSDIATLENGDIITIYNTSGTIIDYIVYDIYKTSPQDLEVINQDTNNLKIITLVTCNTLDNKYRTIVKAKEL